MVSRRELPLYHEAARGDASGASTIDELIRLARAQQGIAREMLDRMEAINPRNGAEPSPEGEAPVEWNLTDREEHVTRLLVEGLSNRQIARSLGISEHTVKNHLHAVFYKLAVNDRTQAVIKLMRGA